MKNEHLALLKEITDEAELIAISGSAGTGQWETGASGVWTGIMGGLGYSCSYPGGFYGPGGTPSYTGSGYGGASGPGGYGGSSSAGANTGS
ncbi:hypothetical protein MUA01_20630 [Enterobacteriaceae bacterium H18W14]|uniref:hypothetical protein n=1 Tax=Dryocola boscaweniae TaxID=2925397 RepID=UPI0022F0C401|nr:hypothetical protein [Dryocola boscaweniae]MCT4717363.1 hypothetical protein [Dryocola boscaweniae]